MSIGSGVLLPGVVEIPPFPILRPLAYTTGLGYRPTCDWIFGLHAYYYSKVVVLSSRCCIRRAVYKLRGDATYKAAAIPWRDTIDSGCDAITAGESIT